MLTPSHASEQARTKKPARTQPEVSENLMIRSAGVGLRVNSKFFGVLPATSVCQALHHQAEDRRDSFGLSSTLIHRARFRPHNRRYGSAMHCSQSAISWAQSMGVEPINVRASM